MTKQQRQEIIDNAVRQLQNMPGDSETAHLAADGILLSVLRELGCVEVVNAWDEAKELAGFWYA
jgi:hypothetical protein